MHKTIPPRPHAVIDYAIVLFFVLAPTLFGFSDDERAATASYIVAAAHLGLSLLTAYPGGVLRVIPFPTHGLVELLVGGLLIALPWLVGFDNNETARNVFIVAGLAVFPVWLLTDYRRSDVSSRIGRTGSPLTR